MPNILLTNYCNRNCPYCFAKARVKLGTASGQWEMSQEELETVLKYLGPGRGLVSLLGGEPTLHSRYSDIVRSLAQRGYDVKLFTNGTTPELRQSLPPASRGLFTVILNLNHPDTYTPQEWAQIEANCRCLGGRLGLSFNIFTTPFTWEYLREAIVTWKLGSVIRIGLAQPIHGTPNAFLNEAQMDEACHALVAMAEAAAQDGITLGFDCGFRLCMFSPEQRGTLAECGTRFLFDCKPILDIGPELAVWRCFPFSNEPGVKLTDFGSLREIEEHFERRWAQEQTRGNTPPCRACRNRRTGTCRGGCLSRTLSLARGGDGHA
jgi:MoaA/NifB/PqqE/SkfB family radical SAM enzyme